MTCKAVFIEQPMAGNEHKAVKCKFHKRENISAHISLLFILVLVLIAGALWRRCWIVACLVHTKQLLQLWARSLSSFYRRGNRRHHHRHHQHHHDQLTTLMATSVSLHLPELTTPKLPRPSSFRIFTSSLKYIMIWFNIIEHLRQHLEQKLNFGVSRPSSFRIFTSSLRYHTTMQNGAILAIRGTFVTN